MEENNSSSEVEVDPYDETVDLNLNYSTPMASTASSPLFHSKNQSTMTHFNGPIVFFSAREVISTSTGLVASVTWPDLRYPCSLAGNSQEPRLPMHLDGNLRATHRSTTHVDAAYCYRPSILLCRSVCRSDTFVGPAKIAEPIEMPFGLWARVGSRTVY